MHIYPYNLQILQHGCIKLAKHLKIELKFPTEVLLV